MNATIVQELERFVRILPDELAWDTLARQGWRLVDFDGTIETWRRDGTWTQVHRARKGD